MVDELAITISGRLRCPTCKRPPEAPILAPDAVFTCQTCGHVAALLSWVQPVQMQLGAPVGLWPEATQRRVQE